MNKITLKIKKLRNNTLNLPQYKTKGSAGFDLQAFTLENINLAPNEVKLIPTGLAFEIPYGYELEIRPRSGLAIKNGITVLNTPGTIDSDYRGEVKIILYNASKQDFIINNGDRICQAVLKEVIQADIVEVEELSETQRGTGGFGHTGIN